MDCSCKDCLTRCPSVSLEEWRRTLCVNPFYFWQFGMDYYLNRETLIPVNSGAPCNAVVYEACFNSSFVGRNEIWSALLAADDKFSNYVGYHPDWRYGWDHDEMSFKRPYIGGPLRLKFAKLKELGQETYTLMGQVTIQTTDITDTDGDNLPDEVTLTMPVVSGVPVDELCVFFTEDDWKHDDRCRNELRPIKAKVVGTNWVITFPSWMAVKPKVYSGMNQGPLNPEDLNNYALSFDVYRRWADPSTAITIMRRNNVCDCGNTEECYDCEAGEACVINHERSIIDIRPVLNNKCCQKCIHKICIHYRSGDCGHPELIANLAAAGLQRPICCEKGINETLAWQQADFISLTAKGQIATPLSQLERSNSFGTARGAIDAYRFLRGRRMRKAVRI